ncbi:pentatricopeptide repeat-containing protein mitochondrial-like [Dorcoceras hygrometricum]|uniref:Pentatricopeptide repeat-containing protein mitochondrial-like n=1 Tax=Dorcoceras hygrometricum TaxID=472368 RepID=A0A2Z7DCF7_9LAMI|nr:pentatricopeptide repeat-containing protein mitochondrial-like [Dorcoceras hygrometricum]
MLYFRRSLCLLNIKALPETDLNLYSTFCTKAIPKLPPRTSKFVVYCNTQITKHGQNGDIYEAESIFHRMPAKNVVSYTALLSAYANNGKISDARRVFDEMPHRTVAAWNAMITAYVRNVYRVDGVEEGYRLFLRMPNRNAVSYAVMITGFVKVGRLDEAGRLYGETPRNYRDPFSSNVMINGYLKSGKLEEAVNVFEGMVEKNVVTWSSMVDGYCKSGRVSMARKLFDMLEECRNEFTWCAMIDGYLKAGCFEDGLELFLRMRREDKVGVEPTVAAVVFEACGKMNRYRVGCQLHGLYSRLGFEFDVFLGNSILTMYMRLGCMGAATKMFVTMNKRDVVSWNSILYGYVQAGRLEEACEIFEKADAKDSVTWTTMITGFSSKGLMEKCIDLFNKMPELDDVAWTAIISGFVHNGKYEEAICWLIQMLKTAVRPNSLTLSSSVSASAGLASLNHGLQMHALISKMNMEHDLSIKNSLASMYSRCGSINDAYSIFKSITAPNIVSFNSMINGFAHNGYGEEAFKLFRQLIDDELKPNEVTLLGVLSACTHLGLVDEGWEYFRSMSTSYEMTPGPDHYACMVDLLGRAGLLDEATKLINSMPFEAHSGIWGSLLGASRTHLRIDVANLAAQRILELEPNSVVPYVVLSDICSILGKRREEEHLRLFKRLSGIKKNPGCSWITVKDKVKLFLSGDTSDVYFEDMKSTLRTFLSETAQLHSPEADWLPPYKSDSQTTRKIV